MYCSNCGKELSNDAKFCNECGTKVKIKSDIKSESTPTQNLTNNTVPVSNSKGVASLVLGIISFVFGSLILPLPIIGLILGLLQKKKNGIAIAGIIISSISLFCSLFVWGFIILFSISNEPEVDYYSPIEDYIYDEETNEVDNLNNYFKY